MIHRAFLSLFFIISVMTLSSLANQDTEKSKQPAITVKAGIPTAAPTPLGDGTYVGEIRAFAAELPPPTGWRECDGTELKAPTHAQLYNVVGTRFGSTNPTSFKIPDLRGTFVRVWNHGKAAGGVGSNDPDATTRTIPPGGPAYTDSADHVGTTQADEMQTHKHVEPGHQHDVTGYGFDYVNQVEAHTGALINKNPAVATSKVAVQLGGPVDMQGNPTARNGVETRPSNVSLIYCIRDPQWNVTP
jgi:microcystin-dependent protein